MHMVLGPENQGDAIVLVIYNLDRGSSYTITYRRDTDSIKVRWATWGTETPNNSNAQAWTVLALDNPLYKWGEGFLKTFALRQWDTLSDTDRALIEEFLLQVQTARLSQRWLAS